VGHGDGLERGAACRITFLDRSYFSLLVLDAFIVEGLTMSEANYDDQLDEPEDDAICGIHDIPYRPARGCPECGNDDADRKLDTFRDRTLEIRAQRAERRRQS
jgi:hypothetical protein